MNSSDLVFRCLSLAAVAAIVGRSVEWCWSRAVSGELPTIPDVSPFDRGQPAPLVVVEADLPRWHDACNS